MTVSYTKLPYKVSLKTARESPSDFYVTYSKTNHFSKKKEFFAQPLYSFTGDRATDQKFFRKLEIVLTRLFEENTENLKDFEEVLEELNEF